MIPAAHDLLGLPLEDALAELMKSGLSYEVTETIAPRSSVQDGTLRVVQVLDGRLIVSRFPDQDPAAE